MSITGTCCHDITDTWDEVKDGVAYMDYYDDFENTTRCRAVAYGVVCPECKQLYKKWGILLETEQAEKDWLDGKLEYPEMGDDK